MKKLYQLRYFSLASPEQNRCTFLYCLTHGLLECGTVKQWEMTSPLCARALFACESGLSEPEIGLEHAFVLLIWQMKHNKWVKWQNSPGARFAKTTGNCSKFDLIRESAPTAFDHIWCVFAFLTM